MRLMADDASPDGDWTVDVFHFGKILVVASQAETLGGIRDEHLGVLRSVWVVAAKAVVVRHREVHRALMIERMTVAAQILSGKIKAKQVLLRVGIFMTIHASDIGGRPMLD